MRKILIKLLLMMVAILVCLLRDYFNLYDIFIFIILIMSLIVEFFQKKESIEFITTYMLWIVLSVIVLFLREIEIIDVDNIFLKVLIFKIILVGFNYWRFKKIEVPNTILSKVWLISLFLYLSEIILNTTHGTKTLFLLTSVISIIESALVIFKLKKWQPKVLTFFSLVHRRS